MRPLDLYGSDDMDRNKKRRLAQLLAARIPMSYYNMIHISAANVVVGAYISNTGLVRPDSYNFYCTEYIPVTPGHTYVLTTSKPMYFVSLSEYSTAADDGFIVRNTFQSPTTTPAVMRCVVTVGQNTNFIRMGSNMFRNVTVTLDDVLGVYWEVFEQ